MKRFLMLVGVAVVAAAMYVAAATGSQQASGPTAKQFKALKAQVASLSKSEKALKKVVGDCVELAVPINQFGDSVNQTEGYDYSQPSGAGNFLTTAIDATSPTDANALWVLGSPAGVHSTACAADLHETALRHSLAKAGFVPHRP
jgi:hypothetical protein